MIMDLKKYLLSDEMQIEFEQFSKLATKEDKDAFAEQRKEKFKQLAPEEQSKIEAQTINGIKNISDRVDDLINGVRLGEVANIISLSYISKKYFGKTRQWLYQRLNGNMVNGKRAKFTDDERKILSKALDEISILIKETGLKIA